MPKKPKAEKISLALDTIVEGVEQLKDAILDMPLKKTLPNPMDDDTFSHMGNASTILQGKRESLEGSQGMMVPIPSGESRLLSDGRWVHRCKECGWMWVSKLQFPTTCGNRTKNPDTDKQVCQTSQWYVGSGAPRKYKKRKPPTDEGVLEEGET
jgi:hypothetical protein